MESIYSMKKKSDPNIAVTDKLTAKEFINPLIAAAGKVKNDNLRFYHGEIKKQRLQELG